MRVIVPFLAVVIIVVFIVLAIKWFSTELHLRDIFAPSGESTSTRLTANNPAADSRPGISAGKEGSKYYIEAEKPPALVVEPPTGFTQKDLSSYFELVKLSSIIRPSRTNGGGFTLITDSSLKEAVDVTNWRIKSNKGEITLRGGPSLLGPVNLLRIILRPRISAVVYGGYSGARSSFVKNAELNKCTGYLNTVYDFNPKLPNNCPSPDRSGIVNFSGACQSFIFSLSNCKMPTAEELNKFTGPNDVACHEFLENINYQNCYNEYSGESGFFSYGWRIWLEDLMPFDLLHDRLLLFDEKRLLVDEYVY